MKIDWLSEAIANNAEWCNAIAASHGIQAQWKNGCWFSEKPMPPFYPNLVTVTKNADVSYELKAINHQGLHGWGIKDSYKTLDLTGHDFSVAFEAQWYGRPPGQSALIDASDKPRTGLRKFTSSESGVQQVMNPTQLVRWVEAWADSAMVFKDTLLSNRSVELLYTTEESETVSGLAMNISGQCVGISNLFGTTDGILRCIEHIVDQYPNRGVVGYGDEDEVARLSAADFVVLGELLVWVRNKLNA